MNRGQLCCRHLLHPSVLVWRLTSCQWGLESGNLVAPILIWEMHLVCNGTYQSSPPLLKFFFSQGQTLQFQLRERRYSINSLMRATLGGRNSNSGQSIERISDMAWVLDPRWKKKSEFFGNKLEKQSFMFRSLHPSSLPSPIEQTLKRKQIYQTVPVQVCTSPLANLKQKYGGGRYTILHTLKPSTPASPPKQETYLQFSVGESLAVILGLILSNTYVLNNGLIHEPGSTRTGKADMLDRTVE